MVLVFWALWWPEIGAEGGGGRLREKREREVKREKRKNKMMEAALKCGFKSWGHFRVGT